MFSPRWQNSEKWEAPFCCIMLRVAMIGSASLVARHSTPAECCVFRESEFRGHKGAFLLTQSLLQIVAFRVAMESPGIVLSTWCELAQHGNLLSIVHSRHDSCISVLKCKLEELFQQLGRLVGAAAPATRVCIPWVRARAQLQARWPGCLP
jgi:hypothetical protein